MCPFIFCPCVQNNTIPWITTSGLKMLWSKRINWHGWQFLVVVYDCCCYCSDDCARCKIKEQKLKDFYLIFCPWSDTEQNQKRRGERVVTSPMWTKRITWAWLGLERATEYYQTCHKRKWRPEILSGSHSAPILIWSWLVFSVRLPPHFQSREKSWIVPLQGKCHSKGCSLILIANLQPTVTIRYMLQMQKCNST